MGIAGSIISSILSGVLIPIAVLAMLIFIGVWTYRDAESKGLNAILWTLAVVLVPSYIGLIIYLCVRYDSKKVTCSKCLKQVNSNTKFCSNCGEELIPVLEEEEDRTGFKKSQKRILIGFFVSFGVAIIATVLTVVFTIIGIVKITDKAVEVVEEVSKTVSLEGLASLDDLLDEEGIRIRVDGNEVYIKDEDGNSLIHVDGDKNIVDIDSSAIKKKLEEHGINVNGEISDEELEQVYQELIEELDDLEDIEDPEEFKNKVHEAIKKHEKKTDAQKSDEGTFNNQSSEK